MQKTSNRISLGSAKEKVPMDVTNDRRHDLQSRGIFVSTRRSGNKPPDCSTQDSFSRNESREQLIHEFANKGREVL